MSKASNHLSKSSQIKGPRHAVIKNVLKKRVKSRGSVSKARLQEVTAELDSEFVAAQNPYAVKSSVQPSRLRESPIQDLAEVMRDL